MSSFVAPSAVARADRRCRWTTVGGRPVVLLSLGVAGAARNTGGNTVGGSRGHYTAAPADRHSLVSCAFSLGVFLRCLAFAFTFPLRLLFFTTPHYSCSPFTLFCSAFARLPFPFAFRQALGPPYLKQKDSEKKRGRKAETDISCSLKISEHTSLG